MAFSQSESSDEGLEDSEIFPIEELLEMCKGEGLEIVRESSGILKSESTEATRQVPALLKDVEESPSNGGDDRNSGEIVDSSSLKKGESCDINGNVVSDDNAGMSNEADITSEGDANALQNNLLNSSQVQSKRVKYYKPATRTNRKALWIRTKNKVRRMRGEPYLGFKTIKNPETQRKNTFQTESRAGRKMGERCKSSYCQKSKNRHCSQFSDADREKLFQEYWKQMPGEARKPYICSLVDKVKPRALKKDVPRPRSATFHYYLKLNGKRIQVCHQMFLNTLGLGRTQVNLWVSGLKEKDSSTELQSLPIPAGIKVRKGGDSCFYKEFLQKLVKLPSHYCRADTTKEYLEPIFKKKIDVYNAYRTECKNNGILPTSVYTFYTYFDENKYDIHQPKKDRCDLCCSFEEGNANKDVYDNHIQRKTLARKSKSEDKKLAKQGRIHCLTIDVQKVLLSPMLNASALYYKTKLMVHNFTVNDIGTNKVVCYLFDETEAELVSSTFATCLIKFFNQYYNDDLPIVIYSDGCTNQNRNGILSSALLHYAVKTKKVIYQKYLEKGHTQMECDHVHSLIEKKIKGSKIFVPTNYIKLCEQARTNPEPFEVKYLHHNDFLDYSQSKYNIRPGSKVGDPVVVDLRQIKYTVDGKIYYQLGYEEDWKEIQREFKINESFSFPPLYNNRLPIPKRKFQDLRDLLHVIPSEHHQYYNSLPCK